MSRIWNRSTGVVVLMLAAGQAAAQLPAQTEQQQVQQRQQTQQSQQSQHRSGGQTGQLDKHLAKLLIAKNEAAIKINEFTQQQAQDQQVKQYASKMVQAHKQLNQKLQKVAGSSQSAQSSSQQGNAAEQLVQVLERSESQFTQALIEGLRKKQGGQLDNTVMGLEVLGHLRMIEALEVMQQQASGELQQTLQQAHQETQTHLQEAEQLSEKIEQSAVAQRTQPGQSQQQ